MVRRWWRLIAFAQHHGDKRRDGDKGEQANDDDGEFHNPKLTFGRADGNSLVSGGFHLNTFLSRPRPVLITSSRHISPIVTLG